MKQVNLNLFDVLRKRDPQVILTQYMLGSHSNNGDEVIEIFKKGNKIKIKKKNRGKFTDYCGGTVTSECIQRGKNSPNPTIRKRATFAANARKWKHKEGGVINPFIILN